MNKIDNFLKDLELNDNFLPDLINEEDIRFNNKSILSIYNLSVIINDKIILRNVNINLLENGIIGLFGQSGSGKTVLFNVILGLFPEDCVYGTFIINKFKLNYGQYKKVVAKLSLLYIPQDPASYVNHNMTLFEHFKMFSDYNAKVNRQFVAERLSEVRLKQAELLVDRLPGELSGGQLQRFVISLVISRNPKIILADEPTAALDICNEINVFKILKQLSIKYKFSLILISHNPALIVHFCNLIYVLKNGLIIEEIIKNEFSRTA